MRVSSSIVFPEAVPGLASQVLQQAHEAFIEPWAGRVVIPLLLAIEDARVMIPMVAVVDIDETRTCIGIENIAGEDAAETELIASVARFVLLCRLEDRRPARVVQNVIGAPVETRDSPKLSSPSKGAPVSEASTSAFKSRKRSSRSSLLPCVSPANDSNTVVGSRSSPVNRVGRKPAPIEPRARACELRRHEGRKRVRFTPLGFELVRDDAAEARDLASDGDVERAARLGMVLPVEMDELGSAHRTHEHDFVHFFVELRKECARYGEVALELHHIEVFGCIAGFFEIPAVHRANGAAHLDEDAVSRRASRFAIPVRVDLDRPHEMIETGAREREPTPAEHLSTRRQYVLYASHGVLPVIRVIN